MRGSTSVSTQINTDWMVDLTLKTTSSELEGTPKLAARDVLLDTVASILGGAQMSVSEPVVRTMQSVRGPGSSVLLIDDLKQTLSLSGAVYVNAHLANILDSDETVLNRAHFAAAVVPCAIAAAQACHSSGEDLLAAIVVGYEVASRVGLAMPHFEHDQTGAVKHTLTGYSPAAFGAAAAAGRLMRLSREELAHAFSIVGKTAPVHFDWGDEAGFAGFFSTDVKSGLHKYAMFGAIAEAGIDAVVLAKNGFVGAPGVFDEPHRFFASFGATRVVDEILLAALDTWWIEKAALKPWPSCRFGHHALTAFHDVWQTDDMSIEDVDKVEITIPPFPFLKRMMDSSQPDRPEKLWLSVPMAMAMIAARVPAGPQWWAPEHFNDPRVRSFADRVECSIDHASGRDMPEQLSRHGGYVTIPTTVRIHAKGSVTEVHREFAWGDGLGTDRALSPGELHSKFMEYSRRLLGETCAERLYARLADVEGRPDCADLFDGLAD
jgi:2-methylcitrate dehydratase PrpD